MIQGIRNNPTTYPYHFPKASSAGSTVSTRRVDKFETRLDQTEQSNRALLDELMRMQTDMKVTSQRQQHRLDEEKQARQQLDNTLRSVLGRLAEAEERARRAELTTAETKAALTQLVTHTKNVERAISNSQQGLASKRDASSQRLADIHREMGQFSRTREQLEKDTQNLRNEIQDLKNKYLKNSSTNADSGTHISDLRNTVQELQSKLKTEETSREQRVKQRNFNDIENSLNKNNEDVLMRMSKMEKTVSDMDMLVKKTTAEMEKVLAAEILARRDQGKLLKSKIYECNDNLRVGLATVQGKKLPRGLTNDVNWKLDAVKVHEISEEAAEQVRQNLEKQIKELQKKQKSLEDSVSNVQGAPVTQLIKKEVKTASAKLQAQKSSKNSGPVIVGGPLDQSLDQILFTQEKLKWQTNQLQEELNRLTGGQQSGSLEDRLALMERRITARMDAESRNTNKNVIILKDDIDLLKNNVIRMEAREPTASKGNLEVRSSPSNGKNNESKRGEILDKDTKTPIIVGSEVDQRLDQITFSQEKLRNQNAQMQEELDKLTIGSKPGSLDDRLTDLDRKVTARMDAETRNRNKEVKLLKDDIELLKKRDTTLAGKPQNTIGEDVKILKKEIADTKTGFRKLAESVQVVKTTLGDKLTDETKIRKQETGRLQTDISKIKTWMQKNQ